ncbi:heterokaryon incompatibility protein-domain-containing protein [Dactylonectria estremocensis]|uniref:Heterokaryon incompatibility protein-domain-containing protein n=1 Tax=Dactylonectria estremocensis TaxID=1079267 RepID=A0A9P9J502_9HYPO|nr:heterokaryon incompatibility protein-domain-containing protein [Dactylonectria estremocensis]
MTSEAPPSNDRSDDANKNEHGLDGRQIRILVIEPGKYGDKLICQLETVDLDQKPDFEALSYCWGDKLSMETVLVNDHYHQVTTNLYGALQRLRYNDKPRMIWVDAVCINQKDDNEKAHQVNMMKYIFTTATSTTLFIGDYQDDDIPLERTMDEIPPDSHAGVEIAFSYLRELAEKKHLWYFERGDEADAPPNSLKIWYHSTNVILSLINQPWWSRMWTVQEAVLPARPIVQYGAITAPWKIFDRATQNMRRHFDQQCCHMKSKVHADEPPVVTFYNKVRVIQLRRIRPTPLTSLFNGFCDRMASDPRDMVYGVLGLAEDEAKMAGIEADYTIGTLEVYVRATRKLIQLYGDLTPITRYHHGTPMAGLPSWVPDYSLVGDWEYFSAPLMRSQRSWPPLDRKLILQAGDDPLQLKLSGITLDEIIAVGAVATPSPRGALSYIIDEWVNMLKVVGCWNTPYPVGGGAYEDIAWMLICRGMIWLSGNNNQYRVAIIDSEEDRRLVEEGWSQMKRLRPKHVDLQLLYWQRLFITRTGYIGLASPDVAVGDTVHILVGARTPIILRKTSKETGSSKEGPDTFSSVGSAFVAGIMSGGLLPDEGDAEKMDKFILV